jgi:hypothetical protein
MLSTRLDVSRTFSAPRSRCRTFSPARERLLPGKPTDRYSSEPRAIRGGSASNSLIGRAPQLALRPLSGLNSSIGLGSAPSGHRHGPRPRSMLTGHTGSPRTKAAEAIPGVLPSCGFRGCEHFAEEHRSRCGAPASNQTKKISIVSGKPAAGRMRRTIGYVQFGKPRRRQFITERGVLTRLFHGQVRSASHTQLRVCKCRKVNNSRPRRHHASTVRPGWFVTSAE